MSKCLLIFSLILCVTLAAQDKEGSSVNNEDTKVQEEIRVKKEAIKAKDDEIRRLEAEISEKEKTLKATGKEVVPREKNAAAVKENHSELKAGQVASFNTEDETLRQSLFFDYDFLIEYNRALKLGGGPNMYFGYGLHEKRKLSEGFGLVFQPYLSLGGVKGGLGIGYKTNRSLFTSFFVKGVFLRTLNDPYRLEKDTNYYGVETDIGIGDYFNLSVGYLTVKDKDDLTSAGKNENEFTFGVGLKF